MIWTTHLHPGSPTVVMRNNELYWSGLMDVGFVKKKITEANIVKSSGIVLVKVSQKKAPKDFHDMPFDASCRK